MIKCVVECAVRKIAGEVRIEREQARGVVGDHQQRLSCLSDRLVQPDEALCASLDRIPGDQRLPQCLISM